MCQRLLSYLIHLKLSVTVHQSIRHQLFRVLVAQQSCVSGIVKLSSTLKTKCGTENMKLFCSAKAPLTLKGAKVAVFICILFEKCNILFSNQV